MPEWGGATAFTQINLTENYVHLRKEQAALNLSVASTFKKEMDITKFS